VTNEFAPNQPVGIALRRLRFGVVNCSWFVALALMSHILIWSLVAMTDLCEPITVRTLDENAAIIAVAEPVEKDPTLFDPLAPNSLAVDQLPEAYDGEPLAAPTTATVRSKWDRVFELVWNMSGGFGSLAVLVMMPLVLAGVLLGAGSATPGVDKTVSAFTWTVLLCVVVLPVGSVINLPWGAGPFGQYETILDQSGTITVPNVALYLVLPLVSIAACAIASVRFSLGVSAGVSLPEHVFDAALEAEAGNIRATSLHGGRAAGALKSTLPTGAGSGTTAAANDGPRITDPQPGDAPRRLI